MTISTHDPVAINPRSTKSVNPWHAFDRIYCISIAHRLDRYQRAVSEFQSVGLAGLVEFVIVDKHPSDSENGIYASHIECLRAGLAAGAKRIAVFEDDIVFSGFTVERLKRAVRFMDSETDWHIFFFGCFVNSNRKTKYPSVVKVSYRCTAHGYVINREFAQKLAETSWMGIPYDDFLRAATVDRTYASYPAFAFQGDSRTDNDKLLGVDRARRIFGGLRRLQRWNEFSSRRFIPIIFAHVAAAFALILFLAIHFRLWSR